MSEPGVGDHHGVALDDVFAALADERRRRVLYYLLDAGGVAPLDDLVENVAGSDRSRGREGDPFRVALHHQHLPMLADAGLVEYDPDDRVVRADRIGAAEPYLAFAREAGRRDTTA